MNPTFNLSQIQVAVRARSVLPTDKGENSNPAENVVDITEGQIIVGLTKSFGFDCCFDGDASQESVYQRTVAPLVSKFIEDGTHASVLAYGQTGAGKTHTMFGKSEDPGIIPQSIDDIFNTSADLTNVSIGVSLFEIYNEKLFDLLSTSKMRVPLVMKEECGIFLFPNLSVKWVSSAEEAKTELSHGLCTRSTGSTAQNNASSRSHAIFRLTLARTSEITGQRTESRLNLVDLAGSESVSKTHAQGERLAEANNINKGLLALGNCISSIARKQSYIPFRDSMLTKVLRDALQGEGLTTIIACISPTERDMSETMSTLRYADRAKGLKKPPIPEHLLAQAEASSKKRRFGPLLGPTPAKKKINSTFDNGTPTPRKLGAKPRLNSTTPVGDPFSASFITSTHNRKRFPDVPPPPPPLEESDEMDSMSDISSIHGPSTSSTITSVARSVAQQQARQANNSILLDVTTLSPILRQYAEKVVECLEKRLLNKPRRSLRIAESENRVDETADTPHPSRFAGAAASSFFNDSANETVISGIGLTEARKKTRNAQEETKLNDLTRISEMALEEARGRKRRGGYDDNDATATARDPVENDAEDFLNRKSLKDLTNCQRSKEILNQVASTASPSFPHKSGIGQEILNKTPKRKRSEVEDLMMEEIEADLCLQDNDDFAPTFPPKATLALPSSKKRRSTRRTTMMSAELHQSLNISIAEPAATRRRSARLSKLAPSSMVDMASTSLWTDPDQENHKNVILKILNTANMKMIQTIPAIGPKTAFLIHGFRNRHGPFKSIDDLKSIPGIQKNFFNKFCITHEIKI